MPTVEISPGVFAMCNPTIPSQCTVLKSTSTFVEKGGTTGSTAKGAPYVVPSQVVVGVTGNAKAVEIAKVEIAKESGSTVPIQTVSEQAQAKIAEAASNPVVAQTVVSPTTSANQLASVTKGISNIFKSLFGKKTSKKDEPTEAETIEVTQDTNFSNRIVPSPSYAYIIKMLKQEDAFSKKLLRTDSKLQYYTIENLSYALSKGISKSDAYKNMGSQFGGYPRYKALSENLFQYK